MPRTTPAAAMAARAGICSPSRRAAATSANSGVVPDTVLVSVGPSSSLERKLSSVTTAGKNRPTTANRTAAVALNKLPIATVTVREGARSLDRALDDMAQVFRMGAWTRMRHVVLPQLAPYLAAAARSGLSLVWKIVLIVELLGRPNGVGFEIGVAFQLFDVTRILAYALAFVAVMLAIETFLVQPLERHVSRWRPRSA